MRPKPKDLNLLANASITNASDQSTISISTKQKHSKPIKMTWRLQKRKSNHDVFWASASFINTWNQQALYPISCFTSRRTMITQWQPKYSKLNAWNKEKEKKAMFYSAKLSGNKSLKHILGVFKLKDLSKKHKSFNGWTNRVMIISFVI